MKYRARDLPRMLATPGGRIQLRKGIGYRLFPVLALVARCYRRLFLRRTRLVAVVGSFGKTTTTRALSAAFGVPPHPRLERNAFQWVAMALLRIPPGSPRAAIEVGIGGPGQMDRYARMTRPDVVVVTSIGSEGSESLGSLEAIRSEKAAILRDLTAGDLAVINADDAHVRWMATQTAARVITYGFGEGCDVRAIEAALEWPRGTRLRVRVFGDPREIFVRLVGRPMVYPVLAALAVAHLEGLDPTATADELSGLPPSRGRLEPVGLPGGVDLLCDHFKSTVETMDTALDTLAEVPAQRHIVLFGDLTGPPHGSPDEYRRLGERIAQVADHLIVVGRSFEHYADGARRAGMASTVLHRGGRTPQEAATSLRRILRSGDVVLIKGRRGQALERVRLLLEGQSVRCSLSLCELPPPCARCPMRDRGWSDGQHVLRRDVEA